ncbi:unnamed protein product [Bursaphelenchus okinawaensis]|uniref:UDENN domain-containing protein n=1 Tax=Bursaphelenchus okinawaensis TaxID=465554 RepID=A0A811KX67_9BILA|nr:unnamed protein product [Bursaphelenchus okinawaensis]CAG9113160.1 unnamed protein product [Bursaphelenchus okinawaensis]
MSINEVTTDPKVTRTTFSPDILNNEPLSDWIYAICVVTFDLELGQVIELTYPKNVFLSESTRTNLCYLSFPDSNATSAQDTSYHFRLKSPGIELTDGLNAFSDQAPISLKPCEEFLFGFVHFRQQKNVNLARGYYQKSVVVLSHLPLFGLYQYVVDSMALMFFESGEAILDAVQHIREWPQPVPGTMLNLPWMGNVLQCRIPSKTDIPQAHFTFETNGFNDASSIILPSVHETNFYENTKCIVTHLQTFWELVLIGEPLVVLAPSPNICANLVQSLITLIWPLEFGGDYRPMFTIHDSDFNQITSAVPIPSMVLGVTNPFFSKALAHWPHFLRVGDGSNDQTLIMDKLFKKLSDGKSLDSRPGLYSTYKPFLSADKSLMKKLVNLGNRPDAVQTAILRRHFLELTQSFMIPLERYLSSLMPLRKQINPFKSIPQVKVFEMDEFFANLKKNGPLLTCGVKGDWCGLYTRFIRSPNFKSWLQMRLKDVEQQLSVIHLDVLCSADLSVDVLRDRKQVEIVDLVLKLNEKLSNIDEKDVDKRIRLQKQLGNVMNAVDDDLKQVLLSNENIKALFT